MECGTNRGRGRDGGGRKALFFREYKLCGDGPQAAIRAGYAPRMAAAMARRLLDREPSTLDSEKCEAQGDHRPGVERRGEEQSPSPLETGLPEAVEHPGFKDVTRDMVVSGLYTEASDRSKESSQTCRLKAWELLAKVLGLMGQSGSAGQAGEAQEPMVVRFDLRLAGADGADNADGDGSQIKPDAPQQEDRP